jgi:hypothetical protein
VSHTAACRAGGRKQKSKERVCVCVCVGTTGQGDRPQQEAARKKSMTASSCTPALNMVGLTDLVDNTKSQEEIS